MIFLILKSGTAFSISSFSTSCCSEPTEEFMDCEQKDDTEKKCCCDGAMCNCICCGHIFIPASIMSISLDSKNIFEDLNFQYQNNYFFQIKDLIWHPPQFV